MKKIENAQWQNSSNVAGASYAPDHQLLRITFKNGSEYLYSDVPRSLWEGLAAATSAGAFLSLNIKGAYNARKLEHGEVPIEFGQQPGERENLPNTL